MGRIKEIYIDILESLSVELGRDPTPEEISAGYKRLYKQVTCNSLIIYLQETLDVSVSMLAALLNVTRQTLEVWRECSPDKPPQGDEKFKRLLKLHYFIKQAEVAGVHKDYLLNLLNEPITDAESSETILYYIVNDVASCIPEDKADAIIEKWLDDFRR